MKEQLLKEYFEEVRRNKKKRVATDDFSIIRNDKAYPALFMDAWHDKEKKELGVNAVVFTSSVGVRRDFKFRTDSAAVHYYEELCDTVGTNGNPCELIGKAVILHFEKNGDFQNVRVDEIISKEDLQETLAEMQDDEEERPRKKGKRGKASQRGKQKAYKKRNARRNGDYFAEEEELDDDFDEDTDTEYDSDRGDDFEDFD